MSNSFFSPVVTQKASEAIFEQIRNKIISGDLKPGDKLPGERILMDQFERSRPTIREALRMLENADLIHIVPGGGAVVKEPTTNAIQQPLESLLAIQSISSDELLEYRSLCESAIATWAAVRRTEDDLSAMRRCIASAEGLFDDYDRFIELDIQFHDLVAQASHNRLAAVMENVIHRIVNDMLTAAVHKKGKAALRQMCDDVLAGHRRIYDSIEKQDASLVLEAMKSHLDFFAEDILYPERQQ